MGVDTATVDKSFWKVNSGEQKIEKGILFLNIGIKNFLRLVLNELSSGI